MLLKCHTYHTEGAEHEAEGDHRTRPLLSQSIAAAVVVEDMATLQLEGRGGGRGGRGGRGREGGRERGKEGGREGGKKEGRERGRERVERKGGREGGRGEGGKLNR